MERMSELLAHGFTVRKHWYIFILFQIASPFFLEVIFPSSHWNQTILSSMYLVRIFIPQLDPEYLEVSWLFLFIGHLVSIYTGMRVGMLSC